MSVRAKVKVTYIGDALNVGLVKMSAVYSADKGTENYTYSQATPYLELAMNTSDPEALKHFRVGDEIVLDFTVVTEGAPA